MLTRRRVAISVLLFTLLFILASFIHSPAHRLGLIAPRTMAVTHTVLFQFKSEASADDVKRVSLMFGFHLVQSSVLMWHLGGRSLPRFEGYVHTSYAPETLHQVPEGRQGSLARGTAGMRLAT